jgi:AbrB family looped-hinge helix DNA binding protein
MKTVITVDDNGVITFPKGYLDGLGWEEGDLLEWINHEDGTFELRKIDNA